MISISLTVNGEHRTPDKQIIDISINTFDNDVKFMIMKMLITRGILYFIVNFVDKYLSRLPYNLIFYK